MPYPAQITDGTTDFGGGNLWRSARSIQSTSNGVLWCQFTSTVANVHRFFYSTDNGETWQRNASMDFAVTDQGQQALYIDDDDVMHYLYIDDGPVNGFSAIRYRRGTPNSGANTDYTWGSAQIPYDPFGSSGEIVNYSVGFTQPLDMVVFTKPTDATVKKLFFLTNTGTSGPNWSLQFVECEVNAAGTISNINSTALVTVGSNQYYGSLDWKHATTDPKVAQDSTPHVYVTWTQADATDPLSFRKFAYAAGSWTGGTLRTLDANTLRAYLPHIVYNGTLCAIVYSRVGTPTVVRCLTRDEADTTTTQIDPTALSDGNPLNHRIAYDSNGDLLLVCSASTSNDVKKIKRTAGVWGSWETLLSGSINDDNLSLMRTTSEGGTLGVIYTDIDPIPDLHYYDAVIRVHNLSGTLQGVATLAADLFRTRELAGTLQGIARWAKARLTKVPQGSPGNFVEPDLDFTVFDGYLEGGDGVIHKLIYHEDDQVKGATSALATRADKQDVGSNPLEQRPEFGDFFAQGDFSHGADQVYFHHEGRDPKKFLASEGYDISVEGSLTHLHQIAEAIDSTSIGAVTQADGVVFAAQGTDVRVGNGLFPGTWGTEDPSGAEGATTVLDLTSRGDEVFAALGAAGVHIRSSVGTWTHFQPDAATDLVAGTVTRIAWLKDRLFVVGTGGREIFEVVADSTPTAIKTLPEGWTFESVFEAGAFVYAPAVNADAGLSRVHIFGLNSGASAMEDKGSVQAPRNELLYSGIGYVGQIFLGGGRANDDGGYDPIFYQAIQDDTGFLSLVRISQGVGGSTDCSVLAFEALGDSIVFSWSQGSAALTGERAGIASYHLGRQAFAQHLKKEGSASSAQVQDILFYKGRLILSIEADGLYYEDTSKFVPDALLISSIADWGGASLKVWDRAEISHGALVADTSVTVQYTTEDPSVEEWFSTIVSDTDGDTGKSSRLSNVTSRLFAVKVSSTSNAAGTAAPTVQSFSIRSNLTRAQPEFNLNRFVRVIAKDRKDGKGSVVYKDPTAERIALMLLLDSWVTVWEPGIIWQAFIKGVSDTEPAEPFLSGTQGEPLKEAFLVRLDMIATGEAA